MPEEIDKNKATLTKAERSMYESWTDQYKDIMSQLGSLINELHTTRLHELGREKGLDMDGEDWTFDHAKIEFIRKQKPLETIPGKEKAGD
jgi:hypothetical protein